MPTLFLLLVLVVALATIRGLRRAGVDWTVVLALVITYLAIPALLARAGALDRYDPMPAPAILLLGGLAALTAVLVLMTSVGARLTLGVSLGAVVALQSFRIPVEWMLYRLYVDGIVPVQMTWEGRNLDVVTGVAGLLLGAWLLSGRTVPYAVVLGWNLLGLMLLANIVGTAVLSTPVPFRRFTEGPPNLLPSTFPWIWLPSFLVQVAWGSHLLVFRRLRARGGV